jgi:hypothetical protein
MIPVPQLDAEDNQLNLLGREAEHWVSGNHGPKGKSLYSFLVTILTGVKKGCPRGQKEEAEDAAWDSFKKLIGEDGKIPESRTIERICQDTWNELKEEEKFNSVHFNVIKRTLHDAYSIEQNESEARRVRFAATLADIVGEVFSEGSWRAEDALKITMPSTNSTYTHSRTEGGAVGAVKVLFEELKARQQLGQKSLIEKDTSEEEDAWNALRAIQIDAKEKKTQKQPTQRIDALPLYQQWLINIYPALKQKAIDSENLVSTVALTEALKFRTITKGNAFRQTVLKPLQQFLHRTMRSHPTFRYIGEEISAEKLTEDFGYIPDWASHMISGDWSDATNELFSFASEYAGELIARRINLDQAEKKLFLESLTGHTLVYKGKDGIENKYRQRRGQLMGSITSFPVLCLINAAVCKLAFEDSFPDYIRAKIKRHQKGNKRARPHRLRLSDIPLRINGDDLLMAGTIKTEGLLDISGKAVGLLSSVGKSYSAGGYANMNSTSFITKIRRNGYAASCSFELIPYVNFGLLNGYRRSTSSEDRDDVRISDLGSIATALVRFAPKAMRERLLKLFIKRHEGLLKTSGLPWFLPTHVGGVGLPIVARDGRMIDDLVDERLLTIKALVEEDMREEKLDAWGIEEETKRRVEQEVDQEIWDFFDREVRKALKPSKVDLGLAKAVLVKHKRVMPPSAVGNWQLWSLLMKRFEMYRYDQSDPRLRRAQQATNCIFVDMLLHENIGEIFHKEQVADRKWAKYNCRLYDPSTQSISGGHVKLTRIYSVLFHQTLSVGLLEGKNLALDEIVGQDDQTGGLN